MGQQETSDQAFVSVSLLPDFNLIEELYGCNNGHDHKESNVQKLQNVAIAKGDNGLLLVNPSRPRVHSYPVSVQTHSATPHHATLIDHY